MSNCKDIWFQCETIIHSQVTLKEKMQAICNFLGSQMPAYDWVGFYLSDVKNKKLHLGPFYGAPTEHTSIFYGKGVCGQAAEARKTFLPPPPVTVPKPALKSCIVLPVYFV